MHVPLVYQKFIIDMGFDLSPEIVDFVAGSVAGAVSVAVGQPFDTVKVNFWTEILMTYKLHTDITRLHRSEFKHLMITKVP